MLFMFIVAVYLLCHFPRVLLNFYEMMVIEQAMACSRSVPPPTTAPFSYSAIVKTEKFFGAVVLN